MKEVVVIGVAGGSASGKTTIVQKIKERFSERIQLLCYDDYYYSQEHLSLKQRKSLNYDHPSAFDTERFLHDIMQLKQRNAIDRPVYSYTSHTRLKKTVHVEPADVILLEGFMLFEDARLRDLMDIKIYVDADADERFIRRLLRDVKERGRDLDSVISQYRETVKPMHEQFIEPSKKYADIIIPRGGQNQVAISMLWNRIDAILREFSLKR